MANNQLLLFGKTDLNKVNGVSGFKVGRSWVGGFVLNDYSCGMNDFGLLLTEWYEKNRRMLPWRETGDAYAIWLSEVILQQTRVNQGMPYYQRFIEKYPTIDKLAAASKDEVFKLWQGLGYYRRAENMMKAARVIVNKHESIFPDNYHNLLKLPGIGDYTAAAIASIAYGEKVPVVDGNVYRVLSRIFGIETVIQTSKAKKEFGHLMRSLMKQFHPGTFNEAVMEFGALQCVPANPDCSSCIFNKQCFAYSLNKVQKLPVVKPKVKKRTLFIYYLVTEWEGQIVLRHRRKNEIWKGLYDFPSLEFENEQDAAVILRETESMSFISPQSVIAIKPFQKTYKHQLTHIDITAEFIKVSVGKKPDVAGLSTLQLVQYKELSSYPVSRLVERFLKDGIDVFSVRSSG